MMPYNLTLRAEVRRYYEYEPPHGFLAANPACHGLFYYYLLAHKNFEEEGGWQVVLEGDEDPVYNYKQLFSSIAQAYGVQPEEMAKYWLNVDMQARALKLPKLPNLEKYRFDQKIEIRTQ